MVAENPTFTTIILINALLGGVTQDGVVENDTEPNKLLSDIEEHFFASHCLIWSRISEVPTPRDITPTNERKPEISSIRNIYGTDAAPGVLRTLQCCASTVGWTTSKSVARPGVRFQLVA